MGISFGFFRFGFWGNYVVVCASFLFLKFVIIFVLVIEIQIQ